MKRERFYECLFRSGRKERVAHIRAWDPVVAGQLFRQELREYDVRARGTIVIHDGCGKLALEMPFDPRDSDR